MLLARRVPRSKLCGIARGRGGGRYEGGNATALARVCCKWSAPSLRARRSETSKLEAIEPFHERNTTNRLVSEIEPFARSTQCGRADHFEALSSE